MRLVTLFRGKSPQPTKNPLPSLTPQTGWSQVLEGELGRQVLRSEIWRALLVLAGTRSPSEVMAYLNTLFGSLITIVNQHSGIVNKFLGDGFMAVFGAPVDDAKQCEHAIAAAQDILRTVERLNQEKQIPETRIGMGLHMGKAVTGNVGSSERKEYTII
jgi:class 3 adenylate cyclase